MLLLNNRQVIGILSATLSHVDPRLIDHGKHVSYLVYKILKPLGRFDDKELRDICIAALLHDVGAYKTEEIDRLVVFESVDIWEHSIYGYLFFKYLSPLKDLAPVILFHHANFRDMTNLSPAHALLAELISLVDRAAIHINFAKSSVSFYERLEKFRGTSYTSEVIDMFLKSDLDLDKISDDLHQNQHHG